METASVKTKHQQAPATARSQRWKANGPVRAIASNGTVGWVLSSRVIRDCCPPVMDPEEKQGRDLLCAGKIAGPCARSLSLSLCYFMDEVVSLKRFKISNKHKRPTRFLRLQEVKPVAAGWR